MKKFYILLLLSLLPPVMVVVRAQQLRIEITPSRPTAFQEFEVAYTADREIESIAPPRWGALTLVRELGRSRGSQLSIVNGVQRKSEFYSYRFRVRSRVSGEVFVPGTTAVIDGRECSFERKIITVLPDSSRREPQCRLELDSAAMAGMGGCIVRLVCDRRPDKAAPVLLLDDTKEYTPVSTSYSSQNGQEECIYRYRIDISDTGRHSLTPQLSFGGKAFDAPSYVVWLNDQVGIESSGKGVTGKDAGTAAGAGIVSIEARTRTETGPGSGPGTGPGPETGPGLGLGPETGPGAGLGPRLQTGTGTQPESGPELGAGADSVPKSRPEWTWILYAFLGALVFLWAVIFVRDHTVAAGRNVVVSRFSWRVYFVVAVTLLFVGLLGLCIIGAIRADAGSRVPAYFMMLLMLFSVCWLVFGELRRSAVRLRIDGEILSVTQFAGLGFTRRYELKCFDGITSSMLASRGGAYEYRYLVKDRRRVVRISSYYLKNYEKLSQALSKHCVYRGERPMNLWLEVKEIFR